MPTSRRNMQARRVAHSALIAAILGTSALLADGRTAAAQSSLPRSEAAPAPLREPGAMMDRDGAMIYVDDSFASVEKLRKAIDYARKGQPQLAINTYQDIVDNFGQKLVYLDDNSYLSITDYVRECLLQMPAVKSGMYDQLFGGTAEKEISAAIEDQDLAALIRAGDRYYPSSAALKGLSLAGDWYFERGEFAAAARTWRELLAHPLVKKIQPELLFKTALAENLSQNQAEAKALRDRLAKDSPDATGMVSGQETKLLPKLDELLAMAPWEQVDISGDEWPAFGGGPNRPGLIHTNATIGARLWSVQYSASDGNFGGALEGRAALNAINGPVILGGARFIGGGVVQPAEALGATLSSYPVLSNGTLFVHGGDHVFAVSSNAGTQLWSYPPEGTQAARAQLVNGINNVAALGKLSGSHDSAAIYGDQVFAVLPGNMTAGALAMRMNMPYGNLIMPSRLVCLSRDTGKEIWSRSSDDLKEGALAFVGSPIVTRQGVFVMARKMADQSFIQQYLVRLDRDTGNPSWSCYICSTSSGITYGFPSLGNVPLPTLSDDILYVSTGQGADCAVDANIGRILWLRVSGTKNGTNRSDMQAQLLQNARTVSWKLNPPVVTGDRMFSVDNNKSLRVYDRWGGKLLKSIDCADIDLASIDVLAGVFDSQLVVTGPGSGGYSGGDGGECSVSLDVRSLDDKPQVRWKSVVSTSLNNGAGKLQGRPFLTAGFYYLPFETKLVRVDLQSGKSEEWDWPRTEKDEPGKAGNILVTQEQVVVVNDTEVAGYSKWETARANREAKIAADPKNPERYLALAEISFRTNHQELAQDNMKKAVDLANSAETGPAKADTDLLQRLYHTNLAFAEQLLGKEDPALRDQARFYYQQCQAAAREPEQQSEWRLRLAELAKLQKKYDEAALLYSDVLADPALRSASFHDGDQLQSAGTSAEQQLKSLMDRDPVVYRRFEDQAAALTQRGSGSHDPAVLQQVIDSFPNSKASLAAASDLAALYQDKKEWDNARRVLWWLEPRLAKQPEDQAKAIANLALVSMELKKFPSAVAWASRGARQFKNYAWTPESGGTLVGKKTTFADLREQIVKAGGSGVEGRWPALRNTDHNNPNWDSAPLGPDNQLDGGQLLVTVESAPSLRPPNLVFIRQGDTLHVYDTATGSFLSRNVRLPRNEEAVLLGVTNNTAVLLQHDTAIGVDLQTKKSWTRALHGGSPRGGFAAQPAIGNANGRMIYRVPGGANVTQAGGVVFVNGNQIGPADSVILIDSENGTQIVPGQNADPENVRNMAFAPLAQAGVFSARMIGSKLLVLSSNQIDAYKNDTGEPAWADRAGKAVSMAISGGNAVNFIGNEDLLVAQVDSADGKASSFEICNMDTGEQRKSFKVSDGHVIWRALGDDGTLYVITEQNVEAYDLLTEQPHLIWRNAKIGSHFAAAAALTLDGLVVIDDERNVKCLASDSGAVNWEFKADAANSNDVINGIQKLLLASNTPSTLRSYVDGDLVIYVCEAGSAAFYSAPRPRTNLAWVATKPVESPPTHSIRFSDPYVAELDMGPKGNRVSNGVQLLLHQFAGGLMDLAVTFQRSENDQEGPAIRNWQVVDGGMIFDVGSSVRRPQGDTAPGTIYFWHQKQQ